MVGSTEGQKHYGTLRGTGALWDTEGKEYYGKVHGRGQEHYGKGTLKDRSIIGHPEGQVHYGKDTLIIQAVKGEAGIGEPGKSVSVEPSLQGNILRDRVYGIS